MASLCFIGIESLGLSQKKVEEIYREYCKFPSYLLAGIDWGYDPYEPPGEIPVVIGFWYDK